jgi:hypothetical protein
VYAPEKEQKGYDLGTNYASGEEALLAMDAILEKNGKTKYTITIFKDNVKVASSSKNM